MGNVLKWLTMFIFHDKNVFEAPKTMKKYWVQR